MIDRLPFEARREVVTSFGKGDVLFWKDKEFPDKTGSKDSYIIVLTEVIENKFFLVVRGTTNEVIYNTPSGKKREIFTLNPSEGNLPKKTILDLQYIYKIDIENITQDFSERVKHIGKISPQVPNQLTNKVKSAKTVEKWKKTVICESQQSKL